MLFGLILLNMFHVWKSKGSLRFDIVNDSE